MTWNLLLLTWLFALVSTLSALFIGEVMGQAPCVLCWFQRAFMFPLAVILAIASYRSDFTVWRYALPLTVIGAALAFVHTLLYAGLIPQPIQPCTATGPSCSGAGMTLFGGDSMRTWTPSPRTLGQRFHADLDTHSTAPWTLIPRALGQ